MRLDKFISDTTELSRTDVKKAIKAQRILVNGTFAKSPSEKVSPQDLIHLDGAAIHPYQNRYFMLNKPPGYICATQDGDHPTVLDLLQEPIKQSLHIAGRLDKDTTGLVLITDDGQWSHRVTSPRAACLKRYRVSLAASITNTQMASLEQGILLKNESKPTKPAMVESINSHTIYLSISEGKYHQVKRMLAAVGNHVTALHRDRVGTLSLDATLEMGQYRLLNPSEINSF